MRTEFDSQSQSWSEARRRIVEAGMRFETKRQREAEAAAAEEARKEAMRKEAEAQRLAAIAEARRARVISRFDAAFSMSGKLVTTMRIIAAEVAVKHGVSFEEMRGASRLHRIVLARHEAFWRCRHETLNSLPAIGRYFNKDHTTVLFGIRMHEARLAKGEAA